MNRRRRRHPVEVLPSGFAGFRFPAEVILLAVRWYLRYGLSYRDLEELLAERGVEVDHVTLYRWVQRFTPQLVDAARPCRHDAGDRWHVDETYVRVAGVWRYLYRAVDQFGQVIDVMLSERRDTLAARRFSMGRWSAPLDRSRSPPIELPSIRRSLMSSCQGRFTTWRGMPTTRSKPRPTQGPTQTHGRPQD